MNKDYLQQDNKYFRWYWNICNNALSRELPKDIYTENHHIYPKSIYGKNEVLVKLTAKEHYIVHLCLWQGLRLKYGKSDIKSRKMAFAFTSMGRKSNTHPGRKILSATDYSLIRLAYSEASKNRVFSEEAKEKMSKYAKNRTKEHLQKLSIVGKGKPKNYTRLNFKHSEETKQHLSEMSKYRKPISEETRQKMSVAQSSREHKVGYSINSDNMTFTYDVQIKDKTYTVKGYKNIIKLYNSINNTEVKEDTNGFRYLRNHSRVIIVNKYHDNTNSKT